MMSRQQGLTCILAVASTIALDALQPLPAHAQTPGAELRGPRITLAEAVASTLRQSLNLQQAEAKVEQRRGVSQEAAGPFDQVLFVEGDFSFTERELLRDGRTEEIRRRVPLEFVAIGTVDDPNRGALDRAADDIMANLPTAGSLLFDDCRLGQTQFIVEADGSTVTLCLNSDGVLQGVVLGGRDPSAVTPGVRPGVLPSDLGRDSGERIRVDDLDELIAVLRILEALNEDFLGDIQEQIEETIADLLRNTASLLRSVATIFRIQRARLGQLPEDEQLLDLKLDLGLRRQFRNGLSLTTSLALVGTETNYADKPLNPAFGDSQAPNTFTTSAGIRFLAPLGRGRGRVATAGPERAARAGLRAEQRLFVHAASQEALATVGAYWELAAAQERLRLLAVSAATQREILDSTRELIDAEELPGAEIHRMEARYAEVLSQLASAQQELIKARLDLVEVMGQTASRLEAAPLAADSLPRGDGLEADFETWVGQALAHRNDLAAAAEATLASSLLAQTAKANLRRQIDLLASVSFSGLHESFDQRIYDFSGYVDAVEGKGLPQPPGEQPLPQVGMSGPSYAVALRFSLPFKNNAARGRLVKAQATLAQSQITEGDLERKIRLQLDDLTSALDVKRDELTQQQEVLDNLELSLQASLELFRAGDITLIDTLTTEEQLTDARLAALRVAQDIAILESQILFEAGQLLEGAQSPEEFDPVELKLVEIGAHDPSSPGP